MTACCMLMIFCFFHILLTVCNKCCLMKLLLTFMLTLTIADMVPCVPFILNGAQLPECVKIFKYLRVSRKLLETLRFQSKRWKLDFIVSSSEFIQKKMLSF